MIDIVYPDEEFSVARFKTLAEDTIRGHPGSRKGLCQIIVAGGTGLYISLAGIQHQFSDTISD